MWGDLLFLTVSHIDVEQKNMGVPASRDVLSIIWEALDFELFMNSFGYFRKSCSGQPMWSSWQAKHGRAFHSSRWVCAAASLHRFSIGDEEAFGHISPWGAGEWSARWLGYGRGEPTALLKAVSAPIGLQVPETAAETWLGRRTSWATSHSPTAAETYAKKMHLEEFRA